MRVFCTALFCIGTLALATPAPAGRDQTRVDYDYEYESGSQLAPARKLEPVESASHYDAYIQDVKAAAGGGGAKKGYSQGSGLRTIAVGSANQAKTALGNQNAAAHQAAYVAKNTLAQSAAQASATAQAALAGKQVILSGLEQQVRDAKVGLQGEEMQLQQAKRAAQSAAQAAQQAMHQVNVIQAALNAAQATSENANEAASQAAGELGAQTAMVGAARQRLHSLQEQLHGVRLDFEATQSAARKAQAAAQQAQANASEAAAKAAAAGLSAGGGGHHDTSHEDFPGHRLLVDASSTVKLAQKPTQDTSQAIDSSENLLLDYPTRFLENVQYEQDATNSVPINAASPKPPTTTAPSHPYYTQLKLQSAQLSNPINVLPSILPKLVHYRPHPFSVEANKPIQLPQVLTEPKHILQSPAKPASQKHLQYRVFPVPQKSAPLIPVPVQMPVKNLSPAQIDSPFQWFKLQNPFQKFFHFK